MNSTQKPIRIVITAGPCGGKTSAQSCLIEEFTALGFQVIFLPEAARTIIGAGFLPGKNISVANFQRMVLRQQITFEDDAFRYASLSDKRTLIFSDRGTLDTAAYADEATMYDLSREFGFDLTGLDRYDGVIILGMPPEKHYRQDSQRFEDYPQALAIAERIKRAYLKSNWKFVPSCESFEEKKKILRNVARAMVGIPERREVERKFLCARGINSSSLPKEFLLSKIAITQTYLLTGEGQEERVRRREFSDGTVTYHHTVKQGSGLERLESERIVSADEYSELLFRADRSRNQIQKARHVFHLGGKEIYELDLFEGRHLGLAVLEVELSSADEKVALPDWIPIVREVTGEAAYSNAELAKKE